MSNGPAGEKSTGRRIGTEDVVSAWMIYLVFLGGLILLSTFYLQDDQAEVRLPVIKTHDMATQIDKSPRLNVPAFTTNIGWPRT